MRFPYLVSADQLVAWARQLVTDLNRFAVTSDVPVGGQIIWDAALAIPTGWLLCNNSAKNVVDYKALFAVIQYTYGGAGATFNVPASPAGLTTIIKA